MGAQAGDGFVNVVERYARCRAQRVAHSDKGGGEGGSTSAGNVLVAK